MSIESSHGKPRVMRSRLRAVTAAGADRNPSGDRDAAGRFQAGNAVGRNRTAKRTLTATLRAAVAQALASAPTDAASPQAGAQLAQSALALYNGGRRDLRSNSPIALSHLVRWAVNTTLASHLSSTAATIGADSERGLLLLDRAHACEGRAERASIAALTMARALDERSPRRATDAPWLEPPESGDAT